MASHLADTIFIIIVSRWQDLPFPALNLHLFRKASNVRNGIGMTLPESTNCFIGCVSES